MQPPLQVPRGRWGDRPRLDHDRRLAGSHRQEAARRDHPTADRDTHRSVALGTVGGSTTSPQWVGFDWLGRATDSVNALRTMGPLPFETTHEMSP